MEILFGTGDTLAQQAVEKKGFRNHDLARTSRMAAYGGCKSATLCLWEIADQCSGVWTCSYEVVSDLAEQNQLQEPNTNDHRESGGRSDNLCEHQHVRLPIDNVNS